MKKSHFIVLIIALVVSIASLAVGIGALIGSQKQPINGVDGKDGINGINGQNGADGKDGNGIKSAVINDNGELVITFDDGKVTNLGQIKEVHPHELVLKEVVATQPTCSQVGTKHIVCETCGELIYTIIIDKTPHNYKNTITAPTCTEQGYTTHTCRDCGFVLTDNFTDTIAHDYNINGICYKCGAKDSNYVEGEGTEVAFTDEVTIKFYHTMGQNLRDVLDIYLEEFSTMFPNIHVDYEQVGGYDDVKNQISTEITAGNQPNLAYCYADHVASYNGSGAVQPLLDYIDSTDYIVDANGDKFYIGLSDAVKDQFIPGYYEEGSCYGDKNMYTMPFSKSTEVMYINKTFFDAHQDEFQVPTHWWCDENCPEDCKCSLDYVLKKIKAIDSNCIPLGYDSEANWFITMCEQFGSGYTAARGEHYLFDNATNQGFVAKFREWYQQGLITTQSIYGAYTSGLFVEQGAEAQKSYIYIGSSAGATHQRPSKVNGEYPFEVGIEPIPQVNASKPKVISQGPSVCIFKQDNPNEVLASWLLVKFLTTNVQFQADFSIASGYIPVLKQEIMMQDETFAGQLAEADGGDHVSMLSLKVALKQESAYYTSPAFVGSSEARTQVGTLLASCLTIEDDVANQIASRFAAAIEECKSNDR